MILLTLRQSSLFVELVLRLAVRALRAVAAGASVKFHRLLAGLARRRRHPGCVPAQRPAAGQPRTDDV